jgi:hypothetical protein
MVRELLPTDLRKGLASNHSAALLNVQGTGGRAGVTQRDIEVNVDSTREPDRRLDRRRGSGHALRLGLLLLVNRSIEHARPDRGRRKLIRGYLVRAIKHRQRRECALIKTHVHTSHNAIFVREIAEIAGTARAITDKDCGLTSTVVVGIDAESLLNKRVARAAESAKVRNVRLTTERDRCHKLIRGHAVTPGCTVMDIACSDQSLTPKLWRKATLYKKALSNELKLLVPSLDQAVLPGLVGTRTQGTDGIFGQYSSN